MTLKADLTTDLTAFFATDEFAESVTFTPATGTAKTVSICFEAEDLATQSPQPPGDEMIILVQYADVSAPARGDVYTINAASWYHDEIVGGGRAEGIWHLRVTRSARRDLATWRGEP